MSARKKQRNDDSPLLAWALAHGVQLSGVAVRKDGDGMGVYGK